MIRISMFTIGIRDTLSKSHYIIYIYIDIQVMQINENEVRFCDKKAAQVGKSVLFGRFCLRNFAQLVLII